MKFLRGFTEFLLQIVIFVFAIVWGQLYLILRDALRGFSSFRPHIVLAPC